jgi:hypothetical protein
MSRTCRDAISNSVCLAAVLARRVHYSAFELAGVGRGGYFVSRGRRPYNLSVCDSSQTVAAVWRPSPSRDTARFTKPGRVRYCGRAVRVQIWERRLSGSARRTQVAVDASPIPAIRLFSRMMRCIEPRPSLRSEDPVGIPSQGQPGPYFLRVGQTFLSAGTVLSTSVLDE